MTVQRMDNVGIVVEDRRRDRHRHRNVAGNPAAFDEVRFVLFSERDYSVYESALEQTDQTA